MSTPEEENETLTDLVKKLQDEIGYAKERIKFHEVELARHQRDARHKIQILMKVQPEASIPV